VLPFHCPTEHTVEFLGGALGDFVRKRPPRPETYATTRVLEVGCGGGDVAQRLGKLGYRVVGIDTSRDAVQRARALGVDVREADFLGFEASPFDAVVFTRALHHMTDLAAAMERARKLLLPRGLVLLEEFDVDAMDAATATWLFDVEALLESSGVLRVDMEDARSAPGDPVRRWRAMHVSGHALHAGQAMVDAVSASLGGPQTPGFRVRSVERVPYLYRYLLDRLEASERGYRVAREMLSIEGRRIADGTIQALGLRVVAERA
jgi:SAM-dependent methyltransferase